MTKGKENMPRKERMLLSFPVALLLFLTAAALVGATENLTLQVNAGSQEVAILNLDEGDKSSCSLSIHGGCSNNINFSVTDPAGNMVLDAGRVYDNKSFDFAAQKSGAYALHFDNSFSIVQKTVSLSYDTERVGVDWTMWILATLAAVIVVVALALAYLYISKIRK